MGVLYKYKKLSRRLFMVFICGTTCVSIPGNELVMRNTASRRKHGVSVAARSWSGQQRSKNKPIKSFLICSSFEGEQQIRRLARLVICHNLQGTVVIFFFFIQ